MTILVVTAVDAERDAIVRDLGPAEPVEIGGLPGLRVDTPAGMLHVVSGGIGPVAAAITTANALAVEHYELVASAGIAGGFRDRAGIATIVVADRVTFADLGVRTDTGFLTPRDSLRQRCVAHRLTIEPAPADQSTSTDTYGNISSYFHVTEPHGTLKVTSDSIVDVYPPDPGLYSGGPATQPWEAARPVGRGGALATREGNHESRVGSNIN